MKNYTITVNGVAYNVTVEENSNSVPAASAPIQAQTPKEEKKPSVGSITIEAPMPGNVIDIRVKAGDKVASGDAVVILEAMKMENEIVAPSNGIIASVNVSKGDSVEAGQLLLTIN